MTLRERIANRADYEPCFCEGPWRDVEVADRPETVTGREHPLEGPGCERIRRRERFPARDLTGALR